MEQVPPKPCSLSALPEGSEVLRLPRCEQVALQSLFDNDSDLYLAFRDACIEQFVHDFQLAAALLVAQQDRAAFSRLAHSLKGVLNTLGHTEISPLAHALQLEAERADWPELQRLWLELRARMVAAFGLDALA